MAHDKTLDIQNTISREELARAISDKYVSWDTVRREWKDRTSEIRNYVFATDTTTTTNAQLPWKNKTTLPKLCQIRDNLHANYMAALFPNDEWLDWVAGDEAAADKEKADIVKAYMKNKLNTAHFRMTVSQLVYDYIDYGNAFADVRFVKETAEDALGVVSNTFVGPKLVRVSPLDIVFDITSSSFENAPKIHRHLVQLGTLKKMIEQEPDNKVMLPALTKALDARMKIQSFTSGDVDKSAGFMVDGFGSLMDYYNSGNVEILEFEGDIYDSGANKFMTNQRILVLDRSYVFFHGPIPSWMGQSTKKHVGWRLRPDNLMAMGPLDNLVGMQYRIDHLENLKADVFDLIAHPVLKIKGYVEDFTWAPLERIYMEENADVTSIVPDTTALNADFQIDKLQSKMEEMAGAPKQAMGIRTPGEKTAYEVQSLENAAGRIFQNKITYFEEQFLEPLINAMLEIARRNMDGDDTIRVLDSDIGVVQFIKVTKEDIVSKGRIRPMGARHFAEKARLVQELTAFYTSPIGSDPSVNVHISGKGLAKVMEETLNLERYGLVRDNVRLMEQFETEQFKQMMAAKLQESQTATEDDTKVAAANEVENVEGLDAKQTNGTPTR